LVASLAYWVCPDEL